MKKVIINHTMARTFYLPACPDVDPGTVIQFQYDPGTGPIMASFDLERSYRNFVLYLYDKLRPDYFAIMAALDRFNWSKPASPTSGRMHFLSEIDDVKGLAQR